MSTWIKPLQQSSPIPLWFQIAGQLRDSITVGIFKTGDVLPSENQLNKAFGVSRSTSRTALAKLEQEGLIFRKSGKGSIVVSPRVDLPAHEMFGFSSDMRRRGLKPSYKTLFAGYARASKEITDALGLKVNDLVFQSRRLLLADDYPMGLGVSWLSPNLLKEKVPPTMEDLDKNSLYAWIQTTCGEIITGSTEFIEASVADTTTAAQLQILAGAPLLIVRRRSNDSNGIPAEYAILQFRADRYRLQLQAGMLVK